MSRQFSRDTALGQIMFEEGWTAADMSAATGVHPRTLSDYLNQRRVIQPHHVGLLADALGCDEDELLP